MTLWTHHIPVHSTSFNGEAASHLVRGEACVNILGIGTTIAKHVMCQRPPRNLFVIGEKGALTKSSVALA